MFIDLLIIPSTYSD